MHKYILYSTMFALFSEAAYFDYKIQVKLFYFIVLSNLVVLLFNWDFMLNRYHLCLLAYVSIAGIVGVALGTDRIGLYLQQVIGISIVSIYFYIFIKQQQLSLQDLFRLYATVALWVCVIGLIISLVASLSAGTFIAVRSIMREPAHFVTVVLPAWHYFGSRAIRHGKDRFHAIVVLAAIVLSSSAIGFLGLLLSFFLLFRRYRIYVLLAPILLFTIGAGIYQLNQQVRLRVDDTFRVAAVGDVTGVNLSTLAFVTNGYVAFRALVERPIFGYGIGAHVIAHAKYSPGVTGIDSWSDEFANYNATDANSLLFRTASELGLVGLGIIALFIFRFAVTAGHRLADISAAIVPYFALKLLREGHWFSPEMYFFVWMYFFLWKHGQQHDQHSSTS